jgi:hypothetical protein
MTTVQDDMALLRSFADLEQIRALKAHYGVTIDALVAAPGATDAATALREVFTDDAVLDFGAAAGRFDGIAAITTWFGETMPAMARAMFHSVHGPVIEVDADAARAQWTVIARLIMREPADAEPTLTYGRYDDTYVRTDRGWRQSGLRFTPEPD